VPNIALLPPGLDVARCPIDWKKLQMMPLKQIFYVIFYNSRIVSRKPLTLSNSFLILFTQARNQGAHGGFAPHRKFFNPPGKMHWTSIKIIGHSSKNLGPSQKTLCPSWWPKLVTGLYLRQFCLNPVASHCMRFHSLNF